MELCKEIVKQITDTADAYMKDSDWTDLVLLKFCMVSFGVIVGVLMARKKRTPMLIISSIIFIATFIPIMIRFLPTFFEDAKKVYENNFK